MSLCVLIICTSHNVLGQTGYPTGVWSTEAIHPYHVFTSAGLNVVFASPKGGPIPLDPYSDPRVGAQSLVKNDSIVDHFLSDAHCMSLFNNSIKTSSVDPSQYDAVFVAGGNGALFDLPGDDGVLKILSFFAFGSDRPFGCVCHGTSALLELKDHNNNNKYYVEGKRVTSFDNEEEDIAGRQIGVPYLPFYLESELRKRGALFCNGPPFQPFTTVDEDGRLVCGQQNFSGSAAAELLLAALLRKQRLASVTWMQQETRDTMMEALNGQWTNAHVERVAKKDGRVLYRRRSFNIKQDATFDLLVDVFSDRDAKNHIFSLFFSNGPFVLEEPSSVQRVAWNSKWGHTRWFIIPHAQSFITDVLQKDPRTNNFLWELGVPMDVSELGAIDVPSIAEGDFEYDIVAISKDKTKLVFGHRGYEPPMHVKDRHQLLSCDYLVRFNDFDARVATSMQFNKSKLVKKWVIIGKGRLGSAVGQVLNNIGHSVVYATRGEELNSVHDADVVLLAIPSSEVESVLKRIIPSLDAHKTLIDATNNIGPNVSLVLNATTPSAQQLVANIQVIKCFNTLGSASISSPMSGSIRKDMFYCGGSPDEKTWLQHVLQSMGFNPVDMGDWTNAKSLEALAQLWVFSAYAKNRGPSIAWKLLRK